MSVYPQVRVVMLLLVPVIAVMWILVLIRVANAVVWMLVVLDAVIYILHRLRRVSHDLYQ
jgi:hypothetical protein